MRTKCTNVLQRNSTANQLISLCISVSRPTTRTGSGGMRWLSVNVVMLVLMMLVQVMMRKQERGISETAGGPQGIPLVNNRIKPG